MSVRLKFNGANLGGSFINSWDRPTNTKTSVVCVAAAGYNCNTLSDIIDLTHGDNKGSCV